MVTLLLMYNSFVIFITDVVHPIKGINEAKLTYLYFFAPDAGMF